MFTFNVFDRVFDNPFKLLSTTSALAIGVGVNNILLESGGNILLESGGVILLEEAVDSSNILSRIEADNPLNVYATVNEVFTSSDVDTVNNKLTLTSTGFEKYSDYSITPVYFSTTGTLPAGLQIDTPYVCIDTTGGIEFYPWADDTDFATLPYFREGETITPAMHMSFGMNKIELTDGGLGTHTLYTSTLISDMVDMTDNDYSARSLTSTNPNTFLEMGNDVHGDYFKPVGQSGQKKSLTVAPLYGRLMTFSGVKGDLGADLGGKRYLYSVFTARMKPKYWNNAVTNIIEPSNVTIATGVIYQINHSFITTDIIESGVIASGVLPTGTPVGDTYARKVDANRFTLHPTALDATNNTNVHVFTDTGSGEFYFKAVQRAQTAGNSQYVFDMNYPSGSQHMIAPSIETITDYTDMSSASYIYAVDPSGNSGYIWNSITTAHIPDGSYRKVNWWHPERAVAMTCTDTGLPLENGDYWATSNGSFIKLHRTEAGAIDGANKTAADSDCIKFTARGIGQAYITIIDEMQMADFAMRSDTHTKTYFPDDDSVNVYAMMIDFENPLETGAVISMGRNGLWNLIDGETSAYVAKTLAAGSLAELKFFNAAEPHVSGSHELYSNVVCASDDDPTVHIQALVDYYTDKHGVALEPPVVEPYTLEGWKLTLPWDASELYVGGADEILQPELLTYSSIWFDRSAVFDYTCPEGGATTATATYARTELRHLTDNAWNSETEMKLIWSDVDIPDGEKTVVFQTHDTSAPEFKIVYTGVGAVNSDGLMRILYKATEGAADTTVVLRSDIVRGEEVPIRIRRFVDELQVFLGANVDGITPDWSSNDDVAFSRDGTNGTYYWKMGNYLQIDNPPYTDTPAYTIRHHTGTWSNPASIVTVSDFPVIESSSTQSHSDSLFTGANAIPAPAGIVDGEQLLLIVSQDAAPATNPFTTPSGWTIEQSWTQAGGVGQIVYKRVASSEPSTYDLVCSNTNLSNAVMLRVSGANASPIDIKGISTSAGADPAVAPTVTTTVANTLVLRIASWDASKTLTLAPSGVTVEQYMDISGHDLWVGYEEQISVDASGTVDWDLSSSTSWVCATIAIAPE